MTQIVQKVVCHLPGEAIPTPDDVFRRLPEFGRKRGADGFLIADKLPLQIINEPSMLSQFF